MAGYWRGTAAPDMKAAIPPLFSPSFPTLLTPPHTSTSLPTLLPAKPQSSLVITFLGTTSSRNAPKCDPLCRRFSGITHSQSCAPCCSLLSENKESPSGDHPPISSSKDNMPGEETSEAVPEPRLSALHTSKGCLCFLMPGCFTKSPKDYGHPLRGSLPSGVSVPSWCESRLPPVIPNPCLL